MISKSNKDEIVAIGRITAVMVSMKTGKSTPIPAELRAAIKQA
jgi:acyl-CoA thioesterase FadM